MQIVEVSAEWWQNTLTDMLRLPPDDLNLSGEFLATKRRQIAFWQRLADVPEIIQLDFESPDEMTGWLYDRGIVVKETRYTFFIPETEYHYCQTLAGKIVGYADMKGIDNLPFARLDKRLEV